MNNQKINRRCYISIALDIPAIENRIKYSTRDDNYCFFKSKNQIYFYCENDKYLNCKDLINEFLETQTFLGSKKKWIELSNVFNYEKNQKNNIRKFHSQRKLMIGYLQSECISKYIFYHYLYENCYTGKSLKFGSIFLIDNLIVFYYESENEEINIKSSNDLIKFILPDNWVDIMTPLFIKKENNLWNQSENLSDC